MQEEIAIKEKTWMKIVNKYETEDKIKEFLINAFVDFFMIVGVIIICAILWLMFKKDML